jgi:hypothetical protein
MIFFHIYVLLAMKFSEAIYRAVHIFNSSNNYELFANLIGTMEVGPAPPFGIFMDTSPMKMSRQCTTYSYRSIFAS